MLDEGAAKVSATDGDSAEVLKQARSLWQKYFTLTKELLKFSDQTDSDIFLDLVDQRERLIEKMKALPANDYRDSAECKALIEQIVPLDKQIIYRARAWLNKSRRQNNTVRSYDLVGAAELRGVVFNKKY